MTPHATAIVLSIGDELVIGQTVDTNTAWIAGELRDRGVRVLAHETLPDARDDIAGALARAVERADLVIATGGLGPTADDLTRHALADAMGDRLIVDPRALETLEARYRDAARDMPETNRVQALRPERAAMIDNPHGTAPGLRATIAYDGIPAGSTDVFCLPGPPREMMPMFLERVVPSLRPPGAGTVTTRVLRTVGLGESDLAQRLDDLMHRDRDPLVGTTASGGVVSVRIRCERAAEPETAARLVQDTADEISSRLGAYVFGQADDTPESVIVRELAATQQRVTTAESCTGGLVAARLTAVPGASDVFDAATIAYANAEKSRTLGVPPSLIETHGAVSREVATSMATGASKRMNDAFAVAITGIAGPSGGTDNKPVGTVWIAVHAPANDHTDARRFQFPGDRSDIRERATTAALAMLRLSIMGHTDLDLLWQRER